jgi:hypothetical protein
MISRGVQLLRGTGIRNFSLILYGQDWVIPTGHRIGVFISDANSDQFRYNATMSSVTIRDARIALPFLRNDRLEFLDGGSTPRLESYLSSAAGNPALSAELIAASEIPFDLPPPLWRPVEGEPQ